MARRAAVLRQSRRPRARRRNDRVVKARRCTVRHHRLRRHRQRLPHEGSGPDPRGQAGSLRRRAAPGGQRVRRKVGRRRELWRLSPAPIAGGHQRGRRGDAPRNPRGHRHQRPRSREARPGAEAAHHAHGRRRPFVAAAEARPAQKVQCFPFNWNHATVEAIRLIQDGAIGRPCQARRRIAHPGPGRNSWFYDPDIAQFGASCRTWVSTPSPASRR